MKRPFRTMASATAIAATALLIAGCAGATPDGSAPQSGPLIDQFHPTVREEAVGLDAAHTVYRPADASALGNKAPVVIYANGGCRPANIVFNATLTLLSAHGFVVVADGALDAPSTTETLPEANPDRMLEAIDWVTESEEFEKQLGEYADTEKIAVMGQSCGGVEALVAGADPRVDSVVSLNSGLFEDGSLGYGREALEELHTPVMFLHGGPEATEYQNSLDNFDLVDVPAALIEAEGTGHGGLYFGLRDGREDGTLTVLEEGIEVFVQWLDFTVNDNADAGEYFIGDCGLCDVDRWNVETKGF